MSEDSQEPRHEIEDRNQRVALGTGLYFLEDGGSRSYQLVACVGPVGGGSIKNKRDRDVALGDLPLAIATPLLAGRGPHEAVFLGRRGGPIKSVSGGFNAAAAEMWKCASLDARRPRFHDLRKTGAIRVEAVSSHAVAKAFPSHADTDVTDTYIVPSLEDVWRAVNRAPARSTGRRRRGRFPSRRETYR